MRLSRPFQILCIHPTNPAITAIAENPSPMMRHLVSSITRSLYKSKFLREDMAEFCRVWTGRTSCQDEPEPPWPGPKRWTPLDAPGTSVHERLWCHRAGTPPRRGSFQGRFRYEERRPCDTDTRRLLDAQPLCIGIARCMLYQDAARTPRNTPRPGHPVT